MTFTLYIRLLPALSFSLAVTLGGCNSDREGTVITKKAAITERVGRTNPLSPLAEQKTGTQSLNDQTRAEPENTPVPGNSMESDSYTTLPVQNAEVAVVSSPAPVPENKLTPQPSQFPELMHRTVELRNQVSLVPPGAGGISIEVSQQLTDYANEVRMLAESAPEQLSKEQRTTIEEHAGKLAYQASQIIQGQSQPPFPNRLKSVQRSLEQIQQSLAQPQH